jgi:hypothetical protein
VARPGGVGPASIFSGRNWARGLLTNCPGIEPHTSGTTRIRSSLEKVVDTSSPSTLAKRSRVVTMSGLSSAKSRRSESTSTSVRSTLVAGTWERRASSRKK